MSELIRVEHLVKTYFLGEVQVPALKGVDLTIQAGELRGHHGGFGVGKVYLYEYSRLPGPSDPRRLTSWKERMSPG